MASPAFAANPHGVGASSPARRGGSAVSGAVSRATIACVGVAIGVELGALPVHPVERNGANVIVAIGGASIVRTFAPWNGASRSRRPADRARLLDPGGGRPTELTPAAASTTDGDVVVETPIAATSATAGCAAVGTVVHVGADATARTLATASATAASAMAAQTVAARRRRVAPTDGSARIRTRRRRRAIGDTAARTGSGRTGACGSAASVVRHAAYALVDPVTVTAISSHAASRSNSSCR